MSFLLHQGDLPASLPINGPVAIDTETMGLNPWRDRLCLVQLSFGDGKAHLVQIAAGQKAAPRLTALFADRSIEKIFHFARFDLAALYKAFGVMPEPVFCTKIASKLTRTFTDRHSLKDLARDLAGIEMSKEQQSSDWGAASLTEQQLGYAASDVLYLHRIRASLGELLRRDGRLPLAQAAFDFLPARAKLDLAGWPDTDIFAH